MEAPIPLPLHSTLFMPALLAGHPNPLDFEDEYDMYRSSPSLQEPGRLGDPPAGKNYFLKQLKTFPRCLRTPYSISLFLPIPTYNFLQRNDRTSTQSRFVGGLESGTLGRTVESRYK